MCIKVSGLASKVFRKTFNHVSKDVAHYFPDHMAKGLERMQKTLKLIDCIVEVHDARIPFSGRNPKFRDTLMVRPHLLVLNKIDLAGNAYRDQVEARLREEGVKRVLYTNCKENIDRTIRYELLPAVMDLIAGVERFNRADEDSFNVLIIGVPNVGKSSLINALRRIHLHKGGKATPVGAIAGITRSVMEKIKISEVPKVYVYDSPGIMPPVIPNMDIAMKLALCATLRDHVIGSMTVADYMLYMLNKLGHFQYVVHYGLEEPTDNILYLLTHIAKQHNLVQRHRSPAGGYIFRPHFTRAAQIALKDFREARLGQINLDKDLLESDLCVEHRTEAR